MSRSVNINNTERIIADSIFLIYNDNLTDIRSLFLFRTEASDIVGIPPDTLNTLQEIANAINNDPNFFQTINNELNLKRNISDSYDKTYIDALIAGYYTQIQTNSLLSSKLGASAINSYYNKTEIDGFNNLSPIALVIAIRIPFARTRLSLRLSEILPPASRTRLSSFLFNPG